MNFAVGATGTYQQYLRYKTISKTIDVDHVVLFFLPQNDVLNNHAVLGGSFELPIWTAYMNDKSYADIDVSKFDKSTQRPKSLSDKIIANSFIMRIIYYNVKQLPQKVEIESFGGFFPKDRLTWLGVYNPPADKNWREAWQNTEDAIKMFKHLANQNGASFTFVLVQDSLQIFYSQPKNFLDQSEDTLKTLDFSYPNKRLMRFCKKFEISCLNALPFFLKYIEEENLDRPYYSFKSDGSHTILHEIKLGGQGNLLQYTLCN